MWSNTGFTKLIQKNTQKGSERQLLISQSWKSDNTLGSNSEKSNIDITILEN